MVLLTKDVFIKLKELIDVHVHLTTNEYDDTAGLHHKSEMWQVYINGITVSGNSGGYDIFSTYIGMPSKEEAYRLFKDLVKQAVDSGEVPELNVKLLDDVLTEDKEKQS